MRPVRLLAVAALCAGCNIVYSLDPVVLTLPDAGYRVDRLGYFDTYRPDVGRDTGVRSAVGMACEYAVCPAPLLCAPRSCGPARSCVAPVTLCEQAYVPVCDCAGTTRQNECAARATGGGVAYAGPCDGRSPDDGGADAAGTDAAAGMDAGPSQCVGVACDDGFICCAEPTSPAYGRCHPLSCATCCQRGG